MSMCSTTNLVHIISQLVNKASTMAALCQKRELNLLLIGKTGSGKSATGNSILEAQKFTTSNLTTSGTQEVQVAQAETDDCKVTVVDCPGLGDSSLNNIQETEKMCLNMTKAMDLSGNGFHALLLVLKYGNKYTRDEQEAVNKFKAIFGEHILRDFCIIVMTHGENFYMDVAECESPITFSDWLTQQTGDFQDLLQECNRRCILFQNKATDLEFKKNQTKNLLSMVKDLMYRDIRYTPEHFAQAEKQRVKLVIEAKESYLRTSILIKISELSKDLDQIEASELNRAKYDAALNLKEKTEHLLCEIREEDEGTGVLNDLKDSALLIQKAVLKLLHQADSFNQVNNYEHFFITSSEDDSDDEIRGAFDRIQIRQSDLNWSPECEPTLFPHCEQPKVVLPRINISPTPLSTAHTQSNPVRSKLDGKVVRPVRLIQPNFIKHKIFTGVRTVHYENRCSI